MDYCAAGITATAENAYLQFGPAPFLMAPLRRALHVLPSEAGAPAQLAVSQALALHSAPPLDAGSEPQ
jgi:hypothetical protein